MAAETLNIFLAENDQDDCLLFEDALKEGHTMAKQIAPTVFT